MSDHSTPTSLQAPRTRRRVTPWSILARRLEQAPAATVPVRRRWDIWRAMVAARRPRLDSVVDLRVWALSRAARTPRVTAPALLPTMSQQAWAAAPPAAA